MNRNKEFLLSFINNSISDRAKILGSVSRQLSIISIYTLIFIWVAIPANGQDTIWYENFSLADGTTIDDGSTAWSLQNTGSGTFSVQGNEFMASFNSANEGIWLSDIINISTRSNVVISVDLRSATASTSDYFESDDYLSVYYIMDSGDETLIYEDIAGIGSTTNTEESITVTSGYLNGGTLQVIIKARNSHPTERYYFDNIKITGTETTPCMSANALVSGVLNCSNTSVTLVGNSSKTDVTYNWTGPDGYTTTLQNPEVNYPGAYILTVSDGEGCSAIDIAKVYWDTTPPEVTASVTENISCTTTSVTLIGSSTTPNVTYGWSGPGGFSSNEQNPLVNTLGVYTLTVIDPMNGCPNTSSVEVIAESGPILTFWLEDFLLTDGTTVDNGSTGWSLQNTGSGTFSVQNNEFMASFDSGNEGIWLSDIIDISTKSNVVVSVDLRSATASTNDYFESDDYISVYYIVDGGDETLIYEDFAGLGTTTNTEESITVTSGYLNAGTLQVIIKARNSHPTERYYFDNIEITGSNQTVGAITTTASGPVTCLDQNIQLTASVDNSAATYYWIDPENNVINQQNPEVNIAGNYTVVVSVDGCQAAKTVTIAGGTELPDVSVSGDHMACSSEVPVILNAVSSNTNLSYSWSGPGGFTSNEKSPSVLNSGTYTVKVTDQLNLCANTTSFTVQYGTLLWNEEFKGLPDGTVEDLGITAWSIDNSQIHTVDLSYYSSEAGIPYYFEVKNNKLAAKSTLGEVVWTSYPIDISEADNVFARLDINGEGSLNDSNNCGKDCFDYDYLEVLYKVDGGTEKPFENLGSISGLTALDSIKVSSNIPDGNNLQIIIKAYNTGNNEIFYFDNIQVLALGQGGGPVTASVSGPITCIDSTVTLTASPNIVGNEYTWKGPDNFISNEPVVNVELTGTYTLMVVGNTGCVTSDTVDIEVEKDITLPDISIKSTGEITCTDNIVTINSSSATQDVSYSWTGPENYISDQQNISVGDPGTYILNVKNNTTGCVGLDSITIVPDTIPPANVSATSTGKLTCINNSVVLTGNTSTNQVSYGWTGPEDFSANTKRLPVEKAGTYELTVTDTTNGCISNTSTLVIIDTIVPGINALVSNVLGCNTFFATLTASSPTSGVTYLWTGPSDYSSSQQNPVTTTPGNYTVTATDPINGCISSTQTTVEVDHTAPENISASVSGVLNCTTTLVTLSGTSETSRVNYTWSGPGGFTSNLQNPDVSDPGVYTLTVKDTINQCSSVTKVTVEQTQTLPGEVIASVSGVLTCSDTSVTLSGSSTTSGVNYSWTGPDSFSSTMQNVNVSVPGEYVLEVSSGTTADCRVWDTVFVDQNITPPTDVIASVSDTLDCNNNPVTLTASSSTSGVTYNWTGPLGFVSNEQNPTTWFEGEYTVTVADPVNGCISEEQVIVIKDDCQ